MKGVSKTRDGFDQGFSLIEVLVALVITMIVMASVFMLLQKGQESFRREPEIADMTANARAGLQRISLDLTIAGYNTPASMAIMWSDGGGTPAAPVPDELTIIYADPDIPTVKPFCKAPTGGKGGPPPCSQTIKVSSIVQIDPTTFVPSVIDTSTKTGIQRAYPGGVTLTAIQFPSDDPTSPCFGIQPGIIPFTLTQPPKCTGPSTTDAACEKVNLNHNPGVKGGDINVPKGFNDDVDPNCAVIGLFHIVQYRIFPLPPAENPALERRDLALSGAAGQWTPLAANIENLQVQYSQGLVENFLDVPLLTPNDGLPNTYIVGVRVSVFGRSESTNLQGATQGVFAAEDTHLRRTFTTTLSLRNQLAEAQEKAIELNIVGWN